MVQLKLWRDNMMVYYGTLFLILGIAVFLFIMAGSRKIRNKNLSFVLITLGINILGSPMALFIGGMATDSPYSTALDFWKGFFFIQGIPLFLLLIAFVWWLIRPLKVIAPTSIEKDLEQNSKSTQKKRTRGRPITALRIVIPIILVVGCLSYILYLQDITLKKSHSPNNKNTIKVVKIDSDSSHGSSPVRIKYGLREHVDISIANEGERLDSSNVFVDWKNDYEATITLRGKESVPEVVEFNVSNKSNGPVFKKVQKMVSSFTFQKSESPNLINIIELRETIKSKGPSPSSTVRIYYGKRGSILEKYKEVTLKEMYTTDNFNINWRNDEQVQVEVLEENVVTATIVIDLSK
ncbi:MULTISPECIES: hypothetical protein [Bacillus]|uniref:hypothetical protein n=1 Tax=Bacillus TaxID=1386 RepID=UPI0021131068|nr:hypothetical protein [Bacillus paranthracis]MCQ6525082.1 hypothetical protein [Bacillus paranthracis]MCU5231993.1 hypothetical protein [Bacillus paranthracis]MEC4601559.1 hypothetical protein [Bacillus paranthracis]